MTETLLVRALRRIGKGRFHGTQVLCAQCFPEHDVTPQCVLFPSCRRVNSHMDREVTVKVNRPSQQQSSEPSPHCRGFMVLLPKVTGGERTVNYTGNFPPEANAPRWLLFHSHMLR